jgi:hypothetical protein
MSSTNEYILWVTWGLLTLVPKMLKNPIHDLVYRTQDIMEDILSKVTFAASLIDVLLSSSPPTIDFFKSLPTHCKGLWAAYIILLENLIIAPRYISVLARIRTRAFHSDGRITDTKTAALNLLEQLLTTASKSRTRACSAGLLYHPPQVDLPSVVSSSFLRLSSLLCYGLCSHKPRLMVCHICCRDQWTPSNMMAAARILLF